ncbi:HNH endonuclease [Streptomyces koyangensis]
MGANSRTYKFALASALLEFAAQSRAEVTLDELAVPYAMSLVARQQGAPQAPSGSLMGDKDFLTVARQEAAESTRAGLPTERLLDAARRSMPTMVMRRFHNLGASEVPHLFYELVGPPRRMTVRLTPHLHAIAGSEQAAGLRNELNARWDIVESSFAAGIGRSLVDHGVAVDRATLRLTDKHRRRPVTGVADALAGFQYGRCLICRTPLTGTDRIAVDHVFPYSLMRRFGTVSGWHGPDLDVIWNLAPARTLQRHQERPAAHLRGTVAPVPAQRGDPAVPSPPEEDPATRPQGSGVPRPQRRMAGLSATGAGRL